MTKARGATDDAPRQPSDDLSLLPTPVPSFPQSMPLSGSSSVDTLSSTGSVDSHAGEPQGAVNPLRPPKSPRRPSNSLRPASTSSVHQIDLAHPARAFYGLPSPPTTSSEASGSSIGGSLRLPGSVLQAVPPASTGLQKEASTVSAPEHATAGANGVARPAEDDGGRNKRLSDLRERSAKVCHARGSSASLLTLSRIP